MPRMRIPAVFSLLLLVAVNAEADWMQSAPPLAAAVRPADGMTVQQTPPDFSWPEASRNAQYTLNLTYPDGKTRSLAAPQNYANWNEVLPAGKYRWTVSADGKTSDARTFIVDAD